MYEVGDRVGRYTLEERLGSGGFTVVWRATAAFGESVALKVPNYEGTNDRAEIDRRLRREVDVLRRVDAAGGHPNVVSLRDAALDGPNTFLAMELLRGDDLDAALDAGRLRPGVEAVETVGPGICSALAFLHECDVSHLDLKPRNVYLVDRTPVLIDFNAATRGYADVRFHEDSFKPPELTPDADRGAESGPWSDVYALGKLLAYLLVGDRKYATPGFDPRSEGVDCDDALAEAVARATSADPRRRQQNAAEVLVDLFADEDADARSRIENVDTGETFSLSPGDTVGRADGTARPDVSVRDPDQYVSPRHLRFDYCEGSWYVTDTSTNGTYVRRDGGWIEIQSARGLDRQQRGDVAPRRRPAATRRLEDGDRIALVDPEYPVRFRFATD